MRVLIAFDKFKDAITAHRACEVAAQALQNVRPEWDRDLCPLTDGGDGFEEIIAGAVRGRKIRVTVEDPRGALISAGFSLSPLERFPASAQRELLQMAPLSADAPIAIIEMARASGLALLSLEKRDPRLTTTRGTGQLIRAATAEGAHAIILGIGGTATHDLGLGALDALGLEFQDAAGQRISAPIPQHWDRISQIAGEITPPVPPILIASDVTNPLLGATGAARVYGNQKGLPPDSTEALEAASSRMAQRLCRHYGMSSSLVDRPGTGAAGGIAFGLLCAGLARLQPGFAFTSACLDLERRIRYADLIITGEGRFDATSDLGKGPGALVRQAGVLGKKVHVFAGQIAAKASPGASFHPISPAGLVSRDILEATALNLASAIQEVFLKAY